MQISDLKHLNSPENVLPIALWPSRPRRSSWRRFWRHSFLARVLLFALSSGIGGAFVGALIGFANSQSVPLYRLGSGGLYPEPWWMTVLFCTFANGVWMVIFGLVIGLGVFAAVGLASSRWSASRKRRFARGLKTRLLFPVTCSLIISSVLATFLWVGWQGGFTSKTSDLGDVIEYTALSTLALASCLFAVLLAHFAKTKQPRRQTQPQTERLLPTS